MCALLHRASITRSTGTVRTSAKARLTSVRIQIPDPDRHRNLIVCSLALCQPSLKRSCKSVQMCLRKVANRQTDRQRRLHILLGGGNNNKWSKQFDKWPHCRRTWTVYSLYFTIGRPFPLKIFPCRGVFGPPSNTRFLWPTRLHVTNDISIGSVVFAGLTIVTDRPTDRRRCSLRNNRPSLNLSVWSSAGRFNNKLEMWANAQRDGRPAEYRWRPLFNAAKFG